MLFNYVKVLVRRGNTALIQERYSFYIVDKKGKIH